MKDLLDKLGKENKSEVKQIKIQNNSALEEIIFAYKKELNSLQDKYDLHSLQKRFESILPKDYTAKDITYFSKIVYNYQDNKHFGLLTGIYLSALINNCKEDNFFLDLNNLNLGLEYVGSENCKEITVNGGVNSVGYLMFDGSIIVNGDVNYGCIGSYMQKGKIIVNGNVNCGLIGFKMGLDGEIIINGHIRGIIGIHLDGGTIRINGEWDYCKKDEQNVGWGTIYHKKRKFVYNKQRF